MITFYKLLIENQKNVFDETQIRPVSSYLYDLKLLTEKQINRLNKLIKDSCDLTHPLFSDFNLDYEIQQGLLEKCGLDSSFLPSLSATILQDVNNLVTEPKAKETPNIFSDGTDSMMDCYRNEHPPSPEDSLPIVNIDLVFEHKIPTPSLIEEQTKNNASSSTAYSATFFGSAPSLEAAPKKSHKRKREDDLITDYKQVPKVKKTNRKIVKERTEIEFLTSLPDPTKEQKAQLRKLKNSESARKSRINKAAYTTQLEEKAIRLQKENKELNAKVSDLEKERELLVNKLEQLRGGFSFWDSTSSSEPAEMKEKEKTAELPEDNEDKLLNNTLEDFLLEDTLNDMFYNSK